MSKKGKSITLIEDPRLEPFFITKDDQCYTVNERIQPNKTHFRSKGGGKEYSKPQGFYPHFDQALVKISNEMLHNKQDISSVTEFIENFKQISNQIKSYTNEIRSAI